MTTQSARLVRTLSQRERICFRCPLRECFPHSARCPYNQAAPRRRPHRWKQFQAQIATIAQGQLTCYTFPLDQVKQAQSAVYRFSYSEDRHFHTWTKPVESNQPAGAQYLYVQRLDRSDNPDCATTGETNAERN